MKKSICFVTTGDIKSIATAKRALGLANPLMELGWRVSIIMEDTVENRHRVSMECATGIEVYYFMPGSFIHEIRCKNAIIEKLNPDFLYICAFVTRNVVGICHRSKKLVEQSELQSSIKEVRKWMRMRYFVFEFYSIIYSDALLNASKYLQRLYTVRARYVGCKSLPMLYFPYAYNPEVVHVVEVNSLGMKYDRFKGTFNFVFLGSITRNYGAFTILEAINELKKKNLKFQMLFLGKGADYEEALEFVRRNSLEDVVYMPGYIEEEEISEYFSLASAFVSPMNDTVQDWARCPSKMYMYLPYKKPIITCRIGEPSEILRDKGCYYNPGDAHSLSEQMKQVINGNLALDIDCNDYSWNRRANELNEWIIKIFG